MRKFYLFMALCLTTVFAAKAATQKEVYTVFDGDTTLTYYYDDQRSSHTEATELYDPVNNPNATRFSAYYDKIKRIVISSSMKDANLTSMVRMFYDGKFGLPVSIIEGLPNLNTENVENMDILFFKCSKLKKLDLSTFDTRKVKGMKSMFFGCEALETLNISSFCTDQVTDMMYMFYDCKALKELALMSFDVSKVTISSNMFKNCSSLTTIYCNDDWSTSSVLATSSDMFDGCTALQGGNGTKYDSSNPKDKTYARPDGVGGNKGYFTHKDVSAKIYAVLEPDGKTMTFYYDGKIEARHGKNYGWGIWEDVVTKAVFHESCKDFKPVYISGWFYDFLKLETIENLNYFNTEMATSLSNMFKGCKALTSVDVSSFDTKNATTMEGMFMDCKALTSLDLSSFDTKNVTNMGSMFWGCNALTSLNVSHFNTEQVTNMYGMFNACRALTSLDVSNFNTEKVTTMSYMFCACEALTSLDVSHFNTENVTNMSYMFWDCEKLTALDVSHFNTENVTDMYGMFLDCGALTSLDVSNFNTEKVTTMEKMFMYCVALEEIICKSDWSQSPSLTSSEDMFKGCTKLKGLNGTTFDASYVDVAYAHPDEDGNPGYFSKYYKVTLKAAHGKVGVQEDVDLNKVIPGTVLHLNVLEADEGYEFDKWENYYPTTGLTVTSDTTVTAVFKAKMFTVRFLDWDENLLKREDVAYGSSATPPADPTREGYTFTGWDTDEWQNVRREIKVYATYKKEEQGLDQTNEEMKKCENAKILRDGQILILRGDKMYNVMGGEVK